jgi:threonine/homoserine efflux transporter RhtA
MFVGFAILYRRENSSIYLFYGGGFAVRVFCLRGDDLAVWLTITFCGVSTVRVWDPRRDRVWFERIFSSVR